MFLCNLGYIYNPLCRFFLEMAKFFFILCKAVQMKHRLKSWLMTFQCLHHCSVYVMRCCSYKCASCIVVGRQIIAALENGVSKYPTLEGRFPQVSGITFGFDPTKLPGQRIDPRHVKVQGSFIELDKVCHRFLCIILLAFAISCLFV